MIPVGSNVQRDMWPCVITCYKGTVVGGREGGERMEVGEKERQTDRQTGRQADRQTDRANERERERETDRQTQTQTQTQTDRQTDRDFTKFS